jgi:hypothetical protein
MRNLIAIFILITIGFGACQKDNTSNPYKEVTVSMGSNSASDVYYSLENGTVSTLNRSGWDIAFSTALMSATVLINEGAGVELYCVGDSGKWDLIDQNTIANLKPLFNNKSDWTIGAFNSGQQPQNFNFGWGHYDQPSHNVFGDSIYVIKLADGTFKKFFYRERIGGTATHDLSWANLDGSDPVRTQVNTFSYIDTRNFIHYSITHQAIVEVEPLKGTWDLLFTRYITQIPTGPATVMNYPVTGILSVPGVTVAKVTGVPAEKALDTQASGGYSANADVIGYDWKVSDPITHAVSIADSVSYFVKQASGKKYQLYFTNYGGLEAGTITFKIKTVQ